MGGGVSRASAKRNPPTTKDFWKRVTALFNRIDALGVVDKRVTRAELVLHLGGYAEEADKCVARRLRDEVSCGWCTAAVVSTHALAPAESGVVYGGVRVCMCAACACARARLCVVCTGFHPVV